MGSFAYMTATSRIRRASRLDPRSTAIFAACIWHVYCLLSISVRTIASNSVPNFVPGLSGDYRPQDALPQPLSNRSFWSERDQTEVCVINREANSGSLFLVRLSG